MARITLVYTLKNTFVARDIDHFKALGVQVFEIPSPPFKDPIRFFWNRIREFFIGFWAVFRSSTLVVWFSDYHGFFPLFWARLLNKKSILIVGGYDAVADLQNGHGIFIKADLRAAIARQNFRWATEIWAVDESLILGCPQAKKQFDIRSGIAHFAPEAVKKCKTVPTGYEASFWNPIAKKKKNTLLTVGLFTDRRVAERKGIPDFIRLATLLPEFNCMIIGEEHNSITKNYNLPPNLRVFPKSNANALRQAYSETTFYFQGSRVEGLPNVLCEAMLCECIPIGRNAFGIAKAIGDTGKVYNTSEEFSEVVAFVKQQQTDFGAAARQRIIKMFPAQKRKAAFAKALFKEVRSDE
jgi:glycosyltransferase involved in cell wall biosynthesis